MLNISNTMDNHENKEINDYCPKMAKCPLFRGMMLESLKAKEIYVKFFCKAGLQARLECKRFLVSEKGYKVPFEILPNDSRNVDEIIEFINTHS